LVLLLWYCCGAAIASWPLRLAGDAGKKQDDNVMRWPCPPRVNAAAEGARPAQTRCRTLTPAKDEIGRDPISPAYTFVGAMRSVASCFSVEN